MVNYSTLLKSNNTDKDVITKRIQDNKHESLKQLFSTTEIGHVPSLVIKVNTERAVIEKASLFKEFTNNVLTTSYSHFILDFSNTLFIDSTFLGAVILFLKKVNSMDGTLSLVVNKEKITIISLFENFSTIFSISNSIEEALYNIEGGV